MPRVGVPGDPAAGGVTDRKTRRKRIAPPPAVAPEPAPTGPSPAVVDPAVHAIKVLMKASDGTLPSSVISAVSALNMHDRDLQRAAAHMARIYDLSPSIMLGAKDLSALRDPVDGTQGLSMQTIRRITNDLEPAYIAAMIPGLAKSASDMRARPKVEAKRGGPTGPVSLGQQIEKTHAGEISKFAKVIGKAFDADRLTVAQGIAAALNAAQTTGVSADRLAQNLEVVQRFRTQVHMSWGQALAMAQDATAKHIQFRTFTDVVAFTAPEFAAGAKAESGQSLDQLMAEARANRAAHAIETGQVANRAARAEIMRTGTERPTLTDQALEGFGTASVAGFVGLASFKGAMDDYAKQAESLYQRADELNTKMIADQKLAANSFFNKWIATPAIQIMNWANVGFETTGVLAVRFGTTPDQFALGNPLSAIPAASILVHAAQRAQGEQVSLLPTPWQEWYHAGPRAYLGQSIDDIKAAALGRERIADTLTNEFDLPRFSAEAVEFIAGWFASPDVLAGKWLAGKAAAKVAPLITEARTLGSAGDILTAAPAWERYSGYVEDLVSDAKDDFYQAVKSGDRSQLEVFNRQFHRAWSGGSRGWDGGYLDAIFNEFHARIFASKADEMAALEDALRAPFYGKAELGSLADIGFEARRLAAEQALSEVLASNPDMQTVYEAIRDSETMIADMDPHTQIARSFGMEVPVRTKPIPGFGMIQNLGTKWVTSGWGESGIGRDITKIFTTTPKAMLNVHGDVGLQFERMSRRAGFTEDRVLWYTSQANKAAAGPTLEDSLASLADDFQKEVARTTSESLGIRWQGQGQEILKHLQSEAGTGDVGKTRFQETQTPRVGRMAKTGEPVPYVTGATTDEPSLPQMQTQRVNAVPVLDPITIKRAYFEYAGLGHRLKSYTYKLAGKMPTEVKDGFVRKLDAAPAVLYFDHIEKHLHSLMRFWKFTRVARPAYVSRVVLGDELLRGLATQKSAFERLISQSFEPAREGVLARRMAPVADAYGRFGIRLNKMAGSRGVAAAGETKDVNPEWFMRPGLEDYEALASAHSNVDELSVGFINEAARNYKLAADAGNFETSVPGKDVLHGEKWARVLEHDVHNSPTGLFIAKQIQDGKDLATVRAETRKFVRTNAGRSEYVRINGRAQGLTPDAWANKLAGDVYGYTMGQRDLAGAAVAGKMDPELLVKYPDMVSIRDDAGQIHDVYGRPIIYGPRTESAFLGQASGPHRAMQRWYDWWVKTPEDIMNRQPTYKAWYQRGQQSLTGIAKQQGVVITPEIRAAIDDTAKEFALDQVNHIMFDFTENSRLGEMLGFISPFMQPYVENLAVWGHILARRNPAVVGYVNRLSQLGQETGFIKKDPDSGEWIVPESWWAFSMPLLWIASGGVSRAGAEGQYGGGGFSVSTQLSSLNLFVNSTINVKGMPIPVPSLSPWAGLLLQKYFNSDLPLAHHIPDNVRAYVFQYGAGENTAQETLTDWFLPRYLGLALGSVWPTVFAKDKFEALAQEYYRTQQVLGQTPSVAQARAQAKRTLAYLAFTAAVFPGAAQVKFPSTELDTLFGQKSQELGHVAAQDWWDTNYPQYSSISIPKTVSGMMKDYTGSGLGDVKELSPAGSAVYEKLLHDPEFKDFANNPHTAMWAVALSIFAPPESGWHGDVPNRAARAEVQDNLGDLPDYSNYDLSAFAAEVQRDQIHYKTIEQFAGDDQTANFFRDYRNLSAAYDAKFAHMERKGLDYNDQVWIDTQDAQANDLEQLGKLYPRAADRFLQDRKRGGKQFTFSSKEGDVGVHPMILDMMHHVLDSKTARGFPATEGLRAYDDLRTETIDRLSAGGFSYLDSKGAEAIRANYDATVKDILTTYPEFTKPYELWFSRDLQVNGSVLPSGEKTIRGWAKDKPQLYDKYVTFTTKYDEFGTKLKTVSRKGGEKLDLEKVYQERADFMNKTFAENPEIIRAWRNHFTHGLRISNFEDTYTSPTVFYTRPDWDYVGSPVSARANKWIEHYQHQSLAISEWGHNTGQHTGDKRAALSAWMGRHLGKDPTFDRAVKNMNTWGYGAIAKGYTSQKNPDGTLSDAGADWTALIAAANGMRRQSEALDIHGDDTRVDFNPEDIKWWGDYRSWLGSYVNKIRSKDEVFKRQWDSWSDSYEGRNSDTLLDWLVPPIYFKIGKG